ncbi:hypothetical protein GGX14DRAFT_387670 [Mycena pura]|uniref:Uncharacterized protein n=1 Tax=Mycena pura TaxID=153505 RepID=A0AAD6YM15_9AGAR|nr:hypothetical protein GGX14DRAFT_387670 [Mycena pura]
MSGISKFKRCTTAQRHTSCAEHAGLERVAPSINERCMFELNSAVIDEQQRVGDGAKKARLWTALAKFPGSWIIGQLQHQHNELHQNEVGVGIICDDCADVLKSIRGSSTASSLRPIVCHFAVAKQLAKLEVRGRNNPHVILSRVTKQLPLPLRPWYCTSPKDKNFGDVPAWARPESRGFGPLLAAWAFQNPRPGRSWAARLGPVWLGPGPRLFLFFTVADIKHDCTTSKTTSAAVTPPFRPFIRSY